MKSRQKLPLHEAWAIFFALGVVMLNYPFLHIFNKNTELFGIPLILIYLLVGWPLSIVVIYLFATALGKTPSKNQSKQGRSSREEKQ